MKFKLLQKVFDGSNKWKKEGSYYTLKSPDPEKDRCYFEQSIKEIATPEFDHEKDVLRIAGIANAKIIDRVDEVLDPRGCDLMNYAKNPQLLAHHNYRDPIGQVEEIELEDGGVNFSAWIGDPKKAPLTEKQKEIRSLVKQGILKTVSVGFIPKKIKEPTYNEDGSYKEPYIIESWELLEISIVSVPCNQDSVFGVKSLENSEKTANVDNSTQEKTMKVKNSLNKSKEEIIALLKEQEKASMVVQTLIFSKEKFNKEQAIKWAQDHEFRSDKVDETTDSFRLRQRDPAEFDEGTFRTIDITAGVQAVVGKLKENAGKEGTSNLDDTFKNETSMLLKSIDACSKRMCEMVEKLVAKSEEKPCPSKPDDDEEKKKLSEENNKLLEQSKILGENVSKLSSRVYMLTIALGLLAKDTK